MRNIRTRIALFVSRNQALFVGLLVGGALISVSDKSIVPAVLQAACALGFACAIPRE